MKSDADSEASASAQKAQWPYMGGFLLGVFFLFIDAHVSKISGGLCQPFPRGAEWFGGVGLLALLWSIVDIARGAMKRDTGSIMWGGLGFIVGFLGCTDFAAMQGAEIERTE